MSFLDGVLKPGDGARIADEPDEWPIVRWPYDPNRVDVP